MSGLTRDAEGDEELLNDCEQLMNGNSVVKRVDGWIYFERIHYRLHLHCTVTLHTVSKAAVRVVSTLASDSVDLVFKSRLGGLLS